jgi:hypothetical protein
MAKGGLGRSGPQSIDIKSKSLYLIFVALRRQLFSVERDIQGGHVAGFDHDLAAGFDRFFRRRDKSVLDDRFAIRCDTDPGILARSDKNSEDSCVR